MTALVIGVGQPDRGDDAAGSAVVAAVRRLAPDVATTEVTSPVRLVDAWDGYDDVVVVDAVMSGRAPGEVTVLEAGAGPLPARPGAGGSHGFGVAEAVELARALDRLPRRLLVVGLEAATFEHGRGLSPAVAAGVDAAVRSVLDAVQVQRESGDG